MKNNMKTLIATVLAGSTAFVIQAANNNALSSQNSSSSQGNQTSSSQTQQSGSASQSGSQNAGKQVSLNQLPRAVKKTMMQHSSGANLENIRKTSVDGKQCYTATFDKPDLKGKLVVATDGGLLSLQESREYAVDVLMPNQQKSKIALNQLPQPVQQTIQTEAGQSRISDLNQTQVSGQTLYRADFNREGIHHELYIAPDGKIAAQIQETAFAIEPMQNVRSLTLKDTPKAVQQSVQNKAQGAQVSDVDKAKMNGQTVYSVMLDNNGKLSQWIFDKNGKVVEQAGQSVNEAAGANNSSNQNQNNQSQSQGNQSQSSQGQNQNPNQNSNQQSPNQQSPK